MVNSHEQSEEMFDRYDDMGVDDAATIRQKTGYEPDGTNDDFSADAIRGRNPNLHFQDAQDTQPGNQKGGLSHEAWLDSFRDPAQRRIHEAGIEAGRLAMHPPKET
jgi:hypothetical protein